MPAEMQRILPELAMRDRAERLGLKLFPIRPRKTHNVRWIQMDNMFGLMDFRGLDGAPSRVKRIGEDIYSYEPGVYGNYIPITEKELLTRADPMRPELPIDISDLVLAADQQLIARQDDRMEANVWTLLRTGTLTVSMPGPTGPNIYQDVYTIQTFNASVPWATSATATPMKDLQTVQQLGLGHGIDLGAGAEAYMNQITAFRLLNNANSNDLAGRRSQYGATLNDIGAFNNFFQGQNLPKVVVYDQGYQTLLNDGPITNVAKQFTKFIPDGTAIVVGKRPNGDPIGEWQQTLQMMMPGGNAASGEYRFIKDYSKGINAPLEVPPKIEVHRGFNGGPALFYPNGIVAMSV